MNELNTIYKNATVYSGAITRIGNSQGIRLPQDILKQVDLYADFSQVKGGQIPVDIIVSGDCITIRKKPEPSQKDEWSQEKQADGIMEFLKSVESYTDEERNLIPDAEEFHKLYGAKFRAYDPDIFDFEKAEG